MRVVVASAFRNSSQRHIDRWAHQVSALRTTLRNHYYISIRAVAAEGDSADNTRDRLTSLHVEGVPLSVVDASHGRPHYGSVVHPDRMSSLSKVANTIFSSVLPTDDILVYVESDLIWPADQILNLIRLVDAGYDVVAPMVMAGQAFYDIWAFRKDGRGFSPGYPYHPAIPRHPLQPIPIDSAGSCLVMTGEVARTCRVHDDNALVGWCEDAGAKGYQIWLDPNSRIDHP